MAGSMFQAEVSVSEEGDDRCGFGRYEGGQVRRQEGVVSYRDICGELRVAKSEVVVHIRWIQELDRCACAVRHNFRMLGRWCC
jgi:hypothetical protein